MKKVFNIYIFAILLNIFFLDIISADFPNDLKGDPTDITTVKKKAVGNNGNTVKFSFSDEELVDVINYLAALKEVNVVLPIGPNAIKSKVTIHVDDKLSMDQAWNLLSTILDVAGYNMVERETGTFSIIRTNKEVMREALPVYVGAPEELPETDRRVRYLHFFSNIKVTQEAETELKQVLGALLPPNSFQVDPGANAVIISGKADEIKSVMNIVKLLEQSPFREKLEIVHLQNVLASTVANLFNENILKQPTDRQRYGADAKKPAELSYFSKFVKVIADDRLNSLIVLGREEAVERIRDFVIKYIDTPVEGGRSILHVYELLYLDAAEFVPVLKQIVESTLPSATGQTEAEGSKQSGVEKYFEGPPIVVADTQKGEEKKEGEISKGSNKIIVAARNDDWKKIRELIEDLDVPQPQVVIQILIADLRLDEVRLVGSILRNPACIPLPAGADFQAANVANIITDNADAPTTLAADLLRYFYDSDGKVITSKTSPPYEPGTKSWASVVNTNEPGSTLVSINDCSTCKTWALMQFLNTLNYEKVMNMPHVITVNNQMSKITIGEERFVADEGVGNQGGTATATRKWVPANLTIDVKPRIAYGVDADKLSLYIKVVINDFKTTVITDADKVTREFETTAILNSGEVIAIGGLSRLDDKNSMSQTPFLGQIPIIGNLFRSRKKQTPKTSLTVFIQPTIVQPKLRGGVDKYTRDYIKLTKKYTQEGMLFDSLDPITRWLFKPESRVEESIDNFVRRDELKTDLIYENKLAEQMQQDQEMHMYESQYGSGKKPCVGCPEKKKKRTTSKSKSKPCRSCIAHDDSKDKLEFLLEGEENPLVG